MKLFLNTAKSNSTAPKWMLYVAVLISFFTCFISNENASAKTKQPVKIENNYSYSKKTKTAFNFSRFAFLTPDKIPFFTTKNSLKATILLAEQAFTQQYKTALLKRLDFISGRYFYYHSTTFSVSSKENELYSYIA